MKHIENSYLDDVLIHFRDYFFVKCKPRIANRIFAFTLKGESINHVNPLTP